VLAEHRRLMAAPVPAGANRVLVGHRGPVQMIAGSRVAGTRLPEGGALVLAPAGDRAAIGDRFATPGGDRFAILGVLAFVTVPGGGNPRCGG
jgi:hypothetical protein